MIWVALYALIGVALTLAAYRQNADEVREHHEALVYHRGPVQAWVRIVAGAALAVLIWPLTLTSYLFERANR